MKVALIAAWALVISASAASAQCRVVPLGVSEPAFIQIYSARMAITGAGDLAFMRTLGEGKRMYAHIPPRRTYSNVHSVAVETKDEMVHQVQFILDDNAPDTLGERIRIGAAYVLSLVPGTTERAATAAVDRALRRMRSSRSPATERVGEAAVHVTHFDGAAMISSGRIRR